MTDDIPEFNEHDNENATNAADDALEAEEPSLDFLNDAAAPASAPTSFVDIDNLPDNDDLFDGEMRFDFEDDEDEIARSYPSFSDEPFAAPPQPAEPEEDIPFEVIFEEAFQTAEVKAQPQNIADEFPDLTDFDAPDGNFFADMGFTQSDPQGDAQSGFSPADEVNNFFSSLEFEDDLPADENIGITDTENRANSSAEADFFGSLQFDAEETLDEGGAAVGEAVDDAVADFVSAAAFDDEPEQDDEIGNFFESIQPDTVQTDTAQADALNDFFEDDQFSDETPAEFDEPQFSEADSFFNQYDALETRGSLETSDAPSFSEFESSTDDDAPNFGDFEVEAESAFEEDAPNFGEFEVEEDDDAPNFGEFETFAAEIEESTPVFDANFEETPLFEIEEEVQEEAPAFTDIDSYLASLSADKAPDISPEAQAVFNQSDVDLDRLFSEGLTSSRGAQNFAEGDLERTVNEDWLNEIQASVGEVSATAIVRQRKDRPEDELPERLKKLRKRERNLEKQAEQEQRKEAKQAAKAEKRKTSTHETPKTATSERKAEETIIPENVNFATSRIKPGALSLAQAITLTPAQESKVALLRTLTKAETSVGGSNRLSAIERTYDTPFLRDLADNETAHVEPAKVTEAAHANVKTITTKKAKRRLSVDRLVVTALLFVAVLAPFFVPELRLGDMPPSSLAQDGLDVGAGRQLKRAMFTNLETLERGQLAFVALEYSPASSGELDPMMDAVLRHILLRGARPVIVSTSPFGVLRGTTLINRINEDAEFLRRIDQPDGALVANYDYYLASYISGGAIGLRSFAESPLRALSFDIQGDPTGLELRHLSDFATLTVITDTAEDLRLYVEQVAPLADKPLLVGVSYAALPSAQTFTGNVNVVRGLIGGYADALSYQAAVANARALRRGERVALPTPNVPIEAEVTQEPIMIMTATITAADAVNVRGGGGVSFGVVARAQPNSRVEVIGFNEDSSWVNVRLEDGQEGWINAPLLRINPPELQTPEVPPEATEEGAAVGGKVSHAKPLDQAQPTGTPTPNTESTAEATAEAEITDEFGAVVTATNTPRPTRTPSPTATVTPTETPVSFTLPELTFDGDVDAEDLAQGRYYAINSGIIVTAVIIAGGALFNIVRAVLRRSRRN